MRRVAFIRGLFKVISIILNVVLITALLPFSAAHAAPVGQAAPITQAGGLNGWSAQQANEVVMALSGFVDGQGQQAFTVDYQTAAFAAAEAVYRFPNAPQRADWQWRQAYYTGLIDAPAACDLYATLLQDGLNAAGVTPPDAPNWFAAQEQPKNLLVTDLGARRGYVGSYLFEIAGVGEPSLHFLALRTYGGRTLVFPMCAGRTLVRPGVVTETNLADLTGDGLPEVILADFSADALAFGLTIYNAAAIPPQQLAYNLPGSLGNVRWAVVSPESGKRRAGLIVEGELHLNLGCPLVAQETLAWNGFQIQATGTQLALDALVASGDALCAQALFQHSLDRIAAGSVSALQTARQLVADWPAECAPGESQHPFSLNGCQPDVKDEARFRIALNLAQARDVNRVWAELRAIIDQPSSPKSPWIQTARDFLRVYTSAGRLAQACRSSGDCYPSIDLVRAVRQTSIAYRRSLFDTLSAYGIPIQASGQVDIDRNGLNEHWFTVPGVDPECGPNCLPELWVVVQSNQRFWTHSLGPVDPQQPLAFTQLPAIDRLTTFRVANAVEPASFVVIRDPANGAVEVQPACTAFETRLDAVETGLLAAAIGPSAAARSLSAWRPVVESECDPELLLAENPRLLYLLALARELSGDRQAAAESYTELVNSEAGSLYAYMASARLGLPD